VSPGAIGDFEGLELGDTVGLRDALGAWEGLREAAAGANGADGDTGANGADGAASSTQH
jgi:hypothetical protein